MAKQKYRATEKIEWPDYENRDENGVPGVVVLSPGDEFSEPPEHANIAELEKHGAVEKA